MIIDLAWQLTALASVLTCTGLGFVARGYVTRMDEQRDERRSR